MRHRVSPPQKHSHYCEKGHKLKTGVARRKFPNTNGPGDRQKGRIQAESVIKCAPNRVDISNAIRRLYDGEFMKIVVGSSNPYGDGAAAEKIFEVLKNSELHELVNKSFHDLVD